MKLLNYLALQLYIIKFDVEILFNELKIKYYKLLLKYKKHQMN